MARNGSQTYATLKKKLPCPVSRSWWIMLLYVWVVIHSTTQGPISLSSSGEVWQDNGWGQLVSLRFSYIPQFLAAEFKPQPLFSVLKSGWGKKGKQVHGESEVVQKWYRRVSGVGCTFSGGRGIYPIVRRNLALPILWRSPHVVSPGWLGCRSLPAWFGCDPGGCRREAYLVVRALPLG